MDYNTRRCLRELVTQQHTATHCNTLQHTATHHNTPQHIATRCNTLQHTSPLAQAPQHFILRIDHNDRVRASLLPRARQHTGTHIGTQIYQCESASPVLTATHCNTLQHAHCTTTLAEFCFAEKVLEIMSRFFATLPAICCITGIFFFLQLYLKGAKIPF